ncbi:siderophore-interacting protein [Occultella glacieicola]|uniref:Siderophore-interacting protein n=2 Tax=Occultella glacieicola TaxID=2518684 RepID=A0ABY2DX87_9MICO|nr:siderophore-interacting protein [Occultella glacieicola]
MTAVRSKPETTTLVTLTVLRTERISTNFARVTLGGGDIEQFVPMGFDQWFRLFIPITDPESLGWVPSKLDTFSYLKYLTHAKTERPVLRNYTVRAHRPDGPQGPELDVDFVLHGSAADGTAGPAASWAQTCAPGDVVAILDEGIGFRAEPQAEAVLLVGDETALPAIAGILESLPRATTGRALIEIPASDDRQDVDAPDGVEVTWVIRANQADHHDTPGRAVLDAALALPAPTPGTYVWVSGEQTLPVALRRHLVRGGMAKDDVTFSGYWKAPKRH